MEYFTYLSEFCVGIVQLNNTLTSITDGYTLNACSQPSIDHTHHCVFDKEGPIIAVEMVGSLPPSLMIP